jgi:small subunit ribosomal protein S16
MSVVIRLKRTGGKKDASFRIVVADSRRARDGRFIEQLGFYDPQPREAQYRVDVERTQYWLGVGAQASDQVRSLLKKAGVPLPARPSKSKKPKAAAPAKKTKAVRKSKGASAREKARRLRKRETRVSRKALTAKKKAAGSKKAAEPAVAT